MSFATTYWSVLKSAREHPERAAREVVGRYQRPIFDFLRGRGCSPEDAEDLAQEVLTDVCRVEFLDTADRSKGRFRSLVLAVVRHKLSSHLRKRFAKKRGGGAHWVSLEESGTGGSLQEVLTAAGHESDEEFDRTWILNIVWTAGERLQVESPKLGAAFAFFYEEELSSDEIGERMELSQEEVGRLLSEARRRIRRHVRRAIEEYVTNHEEFNREIAELLKQL